jgi:hypothetical protein
LITKLIVYQIPLQRVRLCDLPDIDAAAPDSALNPAAVRQIRSYFFARGFCFGSGCASVTLAGVSPEASAIGSHPGIPCQMRSAFLAGVMGR